MLREFYHICSALEKKQTKRKILILEENKKRRDSRKRSRLLIKMGSIAASKTLCRLCGLEKEMLSDCLNDSALKADLMTFLPLEVIFLFDKFIH